MEERINWPGWEVVRLIGKGNFGSVYEIRRYVVGTEEHAALKVISLPQRESEIDDLRADGYDDASITQRYHTCLQNIMREYALMSEMKGNSNIVDCDDVRYSQSKNGFGWDIYIKMELLTALTKTLKPEIPDEEVIRVGIDICKALVLCKSRSIVHRDIKPQNIFVSKYGQYKLGDFGIAKISEETVNGTKAGTFQYMAPEVYNSQPYGTSSDLYSLGLVLYWMLNERRTPFLPMPPTMPTTEMEDEAQKRRFRGEPIPEPAHGSEELKRIVMKACAFDPHERYADAAEMLSDLQAISDDSLAERVPKMIPWGSAGFEEDDAMRTVKVSQDQATVTEVIQKTEAAQTTAAQTAAADTYVVKQGPAVKGRRKKTIAALLCCLALLLCCAAAAGVFFHRSGQRFMSAVYYDEQGRRIAEEIYDSDGHCIREDSYDGDRQTGTQSYLETPEARSLNAGDLWETPGVTSVEYTQLFDAEKATDLFFVIGYDASERMLVTHTYRMNADGTVAFDYVTKYERDRQGRLQRFTQQTAAGEQMLVVTVENTTRFGLLTESSYHFETIGGLVWSEDQYVYQQNAEPVLHTETVVYQYP